MIALIEMSLDDRSYIFFCRPPRITVSLTEYRLDSLEIVEEKREFLEQTFGVRGLNVKYDETDDLFELHFFADSLYRVLRFRRWLKTVARLSGEWQPNVKTDWTVNEIDETSGETVSVLWLDTFSSVRSYIKRVKQNAA